MANRRCRLFHVDAFTRERFCGNPAVVVLDADELTEDQMQTIATEVNRETAFVLEEAEAGDHDMQVKFYTPRHRCRSSATPRSLRSTCARRKTASRAASCASARGPASSRSK